MNKAKVMQWVWRFYLPLAGLRGRADIFSPWTKKKKFHVLRRQR